MTATQSKAGRRLDGALATTMAGLAALLAAVAGLAAGPGPERWATLALAALAGLAAATLAGRSRPAR
jgi:peptidoglycan/LPS O-acetylase OafA/YrhL